MPGFWRNQGGGGRLHSGALASLGEFTVRLFWDSHLDLKMASTELTRVQVRLLSSPVGVVKSVYRVSIGDREAALFQLRADRAVIVEAQASVYDADARLVAEIEVDLRLTRQEQLASSRQDF